MTRYFKWFVDGKPADPSYLAADCAALCSGRCTARHAPYCTTIAEESAPPGEWQPRVGGSLTLRTPLGFHYLGYHILTTRQVPTRCGTELIEVEAKDIERGDFLGFICSTWREIKRFRWTQEDVVAYAKWCAEDAAGAHAADWTPTAVLSRAIDRADVRGCIDAIFRGISNVFQSKADAAAWAGAADALAAEDAAEAAAHAREAAIATDAITAVRAAAGAAACAANAAHRASGVMHYHRGDDVRAGAIASLRIYDYAHAKQQKWIEDRIGESLEG